MAQQNYRLNEPFNTYKLSDLISVDGNDAWTWEGRTLCGYISADNYENVIPLGDQLTIDTSAAELSGVWELNKLDLSVHIIGGGDDSYIEISGIIRPPHNIAATTAYFKNVLPLTSVNSRTAYEVKAEARDKDICKFWFNTELYGIIHPGENKSISSVWYDQNIKSIDQNINPIDHGEVSSFSIGYGDSVHLNYGVPAACINEVISVFLAEGGIMHYYSNKNTVNPNHPTLDD